MVNGFFCTYQFFNMYSILSLFNILKEYAISWCGDSSRGMHGTRHFVNTTDSLIVAMPDKPWKCCHDDKIYR